jgi:aminomethyltransferase
MSVSIDEVSEQVAALALQGPNALKILREIVDADLGKLKFFRLAPVDFAGVPVTISRTGYTGDLGYEIWLPAAHAERVWDVLAEKGKLHGVKAAGMLALDVARLEAGFILLEVDYIGAEKALIPSQKYSPFELGLGWTVDLKKDFFIGSKELRHQGDNGTPRQIIGLEVDWRHYEELYRKVGLPPHVPVAAWRGGIPLYNDGRQVGHATTGAWSPSLKKYIALATIKSEHAKPGTSLEMEATVEYERKKVKVSTVKPPFFDPPRKRLLF